MGGWTMAEGQYGKRLVGFGEEGRNSGFLVWLIQELLLCCALTIGYHMCFGGGGDGDQCLCSRGRDSNCVLCPLQWGTMAMTIPCPACTRSWPRAVPPSGMATATPRWTTWTSTPWCATCWGSPRGRTTAPSPTPSACWLTSGASASPRPSGSSLGFSWSWALSPASSSSPRTERLRPGPLPGSSYRAMTMILWLDSTGGAEPRFLCCDFRKAVSICTGWHSLFDALYLCKILHSQTLLIVWLVSYKNIFITKQWTGGFLLQEMLNKKGCLVFHPSLWTLSQWDSRVWQARTEKVNFNICKL